MKAKSSVYRERFALTLEHKPVDRCPIDLGGTPQSTIESDAMIDKLAEVLKGKGDSNTSTMQVDPRKKGTAAYPRFTIERKGAVIRRSPHFRRDTPQSPFSGLKRFRQARTS